MSKHCEQSAAAAGPADRAVLQAAEVIASAPVLALACHENPDGDALGSVLAMAHLALAHGKEVVVSWPSPLVVAPHYDFLPGLELATKAVDFPARPDVMVTFDCGSLSRLGDLAPAARAARQLIVVDHHVSNDGFGTINVIDPTAAASATVVRQLAAALGWELNRNAALCLYTGLVCDTGRFQYDCTSPAVFALAAELAAFDLPIAAVSRQLFECHRLAYLRLAAVALERADYDPDRRFVATWVTREDFERHGVAVDETEGLIDLVRRAGEADVSCVLKETPEGTRVSLRSVTDFDVSTVAVSFGGGGHRGAAGFSSDRPALEVLEAIRQRLPVLA